MKPARLLLSSAWLALCFIAPPVCGQEMEVDYNAAIRLGQQWLDDNVDKDLLGALGVDVDSFTGFARDLQQRLEGDGVLDLAALRPLAEHWLPVLDAHEETQPYAAWLRSQMDTFIVAGQFVEAAPTNAVRWNPTPTQQRTAWQQRLQRAPWPPASQKWVPRLKPRFAAEAIPPELVWIAEIESGFHPAARSPAGAVGMFQFLPATANHYGMAASWFRDDRKDPEKSATAAAKYLRQLHLRFHDWRLAAAAYNAGEGRVSALLRKHGAKTFDALSPHLPAETQMYVPRLEATLLKREGVRLATLPAPGPKS